MENSRAQVFWEIIEVLHQSSLLPHIMIIGSWAEYLYPYYLGDEYAPNLKTRDVDLYFGNFYREIPGSVTLIENFQSAGFMLDEHFIDTGKFFKEGIEVEFLSSWLDGGPGMVELPYMGVMAEKLDNLGILKPITINAHGYDISIPSPASYIAQKLLINKDRLPISKRTKDIEAVRSLLLFLRQKPEEIEALCSLIEDLPEEKQDLILKTAKTHSIDLGQGFL
jgi:hypothetical protein